MKISEKQKAFCREYIKDFNATRAIIDAGYSKKTARSQASLLLTKPNIIKYLKTLTDKIKEESKLTVLDIVKRIDSISLEAEDPNTQLKANDMLMKHLGGYNLNEEVKDVTPTTIIYNVLPENVKC